MLGALCKRFKDVQLTFTIYALGFQTNVRKTLYKEILFIRNFKKANDFRLIFTLYEEMDLMFGNCEITAKYHQITWHSI